ncbi:MAG: protein-glutamate O-methyltransferase CheR [Verrucomicrobiaceae bacterium]|nr:MAG: protein-glutamate O-methyltransferase CheR [Verrucomicrobiaceae bacterium]
MSGTSTPSPFAPNPAPAASPSASPSAPAAPGSPSLFAANRPQLSDPLFQKFAALIYELSGMRFEANKAYFVASKIDIRVQALGLKNFEAYLAYLESPSGRAEYGFLIDEITINETFFFRHEPQLQAFRDEILMPMVAARRAQRQTKFRILSAAASTGDELYTIALMLKDLGLIGKEMQFELVGTDICHDALQKARTGIYRKYNIRNVPASMLATHFDHTVGNGIGTESWAIKADIKQLCRFQEGNLMDSMRLGALGKFDIIFCRNVLIYFDEESKEKVVRNLASVLADDGYILLGHSENVYSQRHILKPDKTHTNAIAYTKAPPGTPKYNV